MNVDITVLKGSAQGKHIHLEERNAGYVVGSGPDAAVVEPTLRAAHFVIQVQKNAVLLHDSEGMISVEGRPTRDAVLFAAGRTNQPKVIEVAGLALRLEPAEDGLVQPVPQERSLERSGEALETILDARPILPRNATNIWSRAERERDRLCDLFAGTLDGEQVHAQILKSQPFVYPPWVQVDCWVPVADKTCTDRVGATVTISPQAHHRYDFEYAVTYWMDDRKKTLKRLLPFEAEEVRALVHHVLRRGRKPSFRHYREKWYEIWMPRNEVRGIARDPIRLLSGLLGLVGSIALMASAFAIGVAALVAAVFLLTITARRKRRIVRTEGKPLGEPRVLSRVDSWQTVIFGIGKHATEFRSRFLEMLESPPNEKFHFHVERVWYWGLDGKEEREQIVLTLGRGLVFCQIYQYGEDLYVGWDGHLNSGQWVEKEVERGIDLTTRRPVSLRSVNPGVQGFSEYDLIDLSCLMEWTHAQLVKLSKQFMREHQIDQEIDFKILRGERQGLANEEGKSPRKKSILGIKRTG